MVLSENNIEKFFSTLIKIVEEKNNVKIKYVLGEKNDENKKVCQNLKTTHLNKKHINNFYS
jgi:hypothetical protein